MLLSGVFASQWGWESIFYVMGGASTVWLILWAVLIGDTPESQKFISQEERDFIVNSLKQNDDNQSTKLKKVICFFCIISSLKYTFFCRNTNFL